MKRPINHIAFTMSLPLDCADAGEIEWDDEVGANTSLKQRDGSCEQKTAPKSRTGCSTQTVSKNALALG